MTEHELEDLYHDLRRKLEGYGSAPPEGLWASIQEQLPAQPRRRRRPLVALLLLATALICLTLGTRTGQQSAPTTAPSDNWFTLFRGETQPAGRAQPAAPTASGAKEAFLKSGPVAADVALAAPAAISAAKTEVGQLAEEEAFASLTAPLRPLRRRNGLVLWPSHRPVPEPIPYPEGKKLATLPATTPEQASASQRKAGVATLFGSRIASAARPRRAPFARHRETAAVNRETSARTVASGLTGRSSAPARRGVAGQRAENRPAFKLGSGQDFAKRTAPTTAARISNEPLALLAVRPPAFPQDEPEVRAKRRPRARPSRRELLLRGWSAQLLAGTGLTYRAVGSGATQLEQLERPSMGFSAQANGAYALTRQLTVSAGLGYAEYATALRYQLSKSGQDSAVSRAIKFRDVYRFITVPLQVQYTLQGNHRWRVGVLGGGTMALLTGARTTEGTACNCSQRQWQPGVGITNPFARTSLQLNAGVFADYQFTPGQWFTIRPQGQLFLNSLTEQASGRAARRPWSLGIQAGYSWDLDPRKR